MDADLIAKVEKLLALANSDNEHEAALAAAKAYSALRKHNLNLSDVERQRREHVSRVLWSGRTVPGEWRHIQTALLRFFFVYPVRLGVPGMYLGVVVGTETNVTIAEYVHAFLARTFRQLWRARRKRLRKRAGRRAAYYKGLLIGLARTLLEQSGGELPPEDPNLPVVAERLHGPLGNSRRAKRVPLSNALRDGYDAGRRLRLRKGVEGRAASHGGMLPCA